jgi:hypothetical protein
MRFRDDRPGELDRARAAVCEWRDANPEGNREQMLAALGPRFHPDYAMVLRGVLFAVDRHLATQTTAGRLTGIANEEAAVMAQARAGVFDDVDEDSALARLEEKWTPAGYHGFGVEHGTWSAMTSNGTAMTGDSCDDLVRKIEAHWQEMQ